MKKMFRSNGAKFTAAAGSLVAAGSTFAQVTLPAEASAAVADIEAKGALMISEYWPVIAAVTVGFVLIKLFKRAASKV